MASIRRVLSPYNGRHPAPVNCVLPPPAQPYSPSHKLFPRASHSLVSVILNLHERLSSSRTSFKKSSYSCLLLFLAGFLLGMFPFRHFDDLRPNDLPVEIKPPNVNARLDDGYNSPSQWSNMDSVRQVEWRSGSGVSFDFVAPSKQLVVITPTYNRAMQGYFLNRVGQVLRLVPPPMMWIVVEMNKASMETTEILRHIGVMYRHLVSRQNLTDVKDRGVHQRNAALEHIKEHRLDGIVYFVDDYNVYTPELFDRLREIYRFGTWLVAMLAQGKSKAILEGPICNGTQVIGSNTTEKIKRFLRFHVDMSGFAFNSKILWVPNRWGHHPLHPIRQLDMVKVGFQETTFIEQVLENEFQMEGVPYAVRKY